MPQPYKVFTIYAREDAQYLEELRGQLKPLENSGRIKVWSDREINPGADWEKEIVQQLDTADIILILVSSAYFNSAYIHDVEIKYAFKRHERGEARVLPIIVRSVAFGDDPIISRLQVLPTDGKPVNDSRYWSDRDNAWLDVVSGLKRTLDILYEFENRRKESVVAAALAVEYEAERQRRIKEKQKQDEITARQHRETERLANEQRARDAALLAEVQRAKKVKLEEGQAEQEHIVYHYRTKEFKQQNSISIPWRAIVVFGFIFGLSLIIIFSKPSENLPSSTNGLLTIFIIGSVAGWLAGQIRQGYGFGLLGNIFVGNLGAFLGGWLFHSVLHLDIGGGLVGIFTTSLIGALVLLFLFGLVRLK